MGLLLYFLMEIFPLWEPGPQNPQSSAVVTELPSVGSLGLMVRGAIPISPLGPWTYPFFLLGCSTIVTVDGMYTVSWKMAPSLVGGTSMLALQLCLHSPFLFSV